MKKKYIDDKVVLISGANSGIGKELAKKFIFNNNCKIIAIGRSKEKFDAFLEELKDKKDNLKYYLFDVSIKENWENLRKDLEKENIQVDVLINCAGILPKFKKINAYSSEEIRNIMDINYFSAVYSVETFYDHLLKSNTPSIINIGSSSALATIVGTGPYSASKSALKAYTEALIYENKKKMYVSLIMPGFAKSDIFRNQNIKIENDKLINFLAMKVSKMGNKIYKTILRKKKRVIIGKDAKLMNFFYKLFPKLTMSIIEKILRKSKNKVFVDVFSD